MARPNMRSCDRPWGIILDVVLVVEMYTDEKGRKNLELCNILHIEAIQIENQYHNPAHLVLSSRVN
jgi:hypothetical protein